MCIAVPEKIVSIRETETGLWGKTERAGIVHETDLSLLDGVRVGDWVLVFRGSALRVVPEEEAMRVEAALRAVSSAAVSPSRTKSLTVTSNDDTSRSVLRMSCAPSRSFFASETSTAAAPFIWMGDVRRSSTRILRASGRRAKKNSPLRRSITGAGATEHLKHGSNRNSHPPTAKTLLLTCTRTTGGIC